MQAVGLFLQELQELMVLFQVAVKLAYKTFTEHQINSLVEINQLLI
jgi:hypothetical protein